MQVHAVRVDEVGDGTNFLAGIDRAQFRTLRNIDGFGLRMVFKAPVGEMRTKKLWCQLAVGRVDWPQRSTGHEGWSTTFIDSDVSSFSAKDAVEWPHAGALSHHIGTGAVEDREKFRLRTELLLENLPRSCGIGVIAVCDFMVGITGRNGL